MGSKRIRSEIKKYIDYASEIFSCWIENILKKTGDNRREDLFFDYLSAEDQNQLMGCSCIRSLDFSSLLKVADRNWYILCNYEDLKNGVRETLRSMYKVRNNWAHSETVFPDKDAVIEDIDAIINFITTFSGDQKITEEIKKFKDDVRELSFVMEAGESPALMNLNIDESEIKEKSIVYIVGTPSVKGMVFSIEEMGDMKVYQVFIDGQFKTFYSGQIALDVEEKQDKWIDVDTLHSYLSAYYINNPASGNLYSLNSARIDFVPYQFRPALKLIKSDEPRILIADSVGVGKTIEAGLIIKELEARKELENIVIICPKPLVAERKWENEMKRFDEEFVALDGPLLRQIVSDTNRDGMWPARYNKVIIPYSIMDGRLYDGEEVGRGKHIGLDELDPAPHFDLVIVDEAHHIRNGNMNKEKAFAYKCTKYFCDHADAVVMLTATPLQTSDEDLFTLLNVLRPDTVVDVKTFKTMAKPNVHISDCVRIVRAAGKNWQTNALRELEKIMFTQWGETVIARNPLYSDVVSRLKRTELSREERVQLITDIESLHSFNSIINRTRRRDIQDFCVRRTFTLETEFTPQQRELHDELLRFEQVALSELHDPRSVSFMMSTIRRQAASCIYGLAPFIRDLINRRYMQLDLNLEELSDLDMSILKDISSHILELADNLPEKDPKIDSVLDIVRQKNELENNKIILFSTFKHTLSYIKKKLESEGLRVAQIDGSVKDSVRYELRSRFEKDKDERDALDILLFTEVGSEGLDYQFCDTMINYDLPWNPMRIEQRIGRIDRRGQKNEFVNIYNVITSGTVDADIYNRCLKRIGIFESSIGECEEILGEIGAAIEKIAMNTMLTDEERKLKLEQMADNEIRKIQEVNRLENEEKDLFGFDLSEYTISKEVQAAEMPWITPANLQLLVESYLKARIGEGTYILGSSEKKTLRIKASARELLREDFKELSGIRSELKRTWNEYLKGSEQLLSITFDPETASKERELVFITAVHPLVKQAARYFSANEVSYINMNYTSDHLPEGEFPFAVYAWNYTGINPRFAIVPVCAEKSVSDELTYILMGGSDISGKAVDENEWKSVEKEHIAYWFEERKKHIESAENIVRYKLESIGNSYRLQRRKLEQRLNSTTDAKLRRMYQSSLDTADEKYERKCREINSAIGQADIHVSLVVKGIVDIERSSL